MKWLFTIALFCMTTTSAAASPSTITSRPFGALPNGETATLFELTNTSGMKVTLSSLGAAIVGISVPDHKGIFDDVVLGYDSVEEYRNDQSYFGFTIGRFANRIGQGTFSLDGTTYTVDRNEGSNHLHGGRGGFHTKNWRSETSQRPDGPSVTFKLVSPAGEQGYPGTVTASATYTLLSDNTLSMQYHATTDAPTIVNLTNHAYFNLAGAGNGDVLSHTLELDADAYTQTDEHLIPTGEIVPVAGTFLDFTTPTAIGLRKAEWPGQLPGYDHNFVVNGRIGKLRRAARLIEPSTGRSLEVHTTAPGIQVYSGIHLKDVAGKKGKRYRPYGGVCLEAQNFPDAPNHKQFPSAVLRPDGAYAATIQYRFGVLK